MKPALLIMMLVCTTTAACTARAGGIDLGDPPPATTAMSLDQGASSQATSTNNRASVNSSPGVSNSDQQAADLHAQLSAPSAAKPAIQPHRAAAPSTVNTPATADDDASHSHAASWQSLLPGSIQ